MMSIKSFTIVQSNTELRGLPLLTRNFTKDGEFQVSPYIFRRPAKQVVLYSSR